MTELDPRVAGTPPALAEAPEPADAPAPDRMPTPGGTPAASAFAAAMGGAPVASQAGSTGQGTAAGSQPSIHPLTAIALDEVSAARASLAVELGGLNQSARAAVDVKAKIRRSPGKAAAAVGGAAFLAVGGPKRLFSAVKRRVMGEPEPLPPSLLPTEVEKAVRALGDDGAKVRGALERGFAGWLDATAKGRKADARQRSLANIALTIGVPVVVKAAQQAISRALTEMEATTRPAPGGASGGSATARTAAPAASTAKAGSAASATAPAANAPAGVPPTR